MVEDTHWGEDAQFRENAGTKSCRACGANDLVWRRSANRHKWILCMLNGIEHTCKVAPLPNLEEL